MSSLHLPRDKLVGYEHYGVCGQPATDVSQLRPQAATGELTYHTCF